MSIRTLALTVGLTVYLIGGLSTASNAETVSKTVKEWMAQVEASEATKTQTGRVAITTIRLDRSEGRLQVILETPAGSLVPTTREVGNSVVIDVPNAVLSLASGKAFRVENPLAGIASVVAMQSSANSVQITIAGTDSAPIVEVVPRSNGLQLSVVPDGETEPEEEITVTGTRDLPTPLPQTGIARDEFSQRNNLQLGDILQRLPGVVGGGPPGENREVRLRGLDKEFTRVQIDGVTLPDGGEKREFQVNRLPSFLVDEVSIIRNPTAEFESDGIAGRVSVKKTTIPKKFVLQGRGGIGAYDRLGSDIWNFQVGIGDRPSPGFGYLGAFSYLKNPIEIDRYKLFSTGKSELEGETNRLEYYDTLLDIAAFYDQGEIHLKPLLLVFNIDKDKFKLFQEPRKAATREEEREIERRYTYGAGLTHQHRFNGGIRLDTDLGYYVASEDKDKTKLTFEQDRRGVFQFRKSSPEQEYKQDDVFNLSTALTIPVQAGLRHEIKLGGAMRLRDRFRDKEKFEIDDRGRRTRTTEAKDNYELSENYFAGFIQDQIWIGDRFSILPGVRIETVSLSSRDGTSRESEKTVTDVNPSLHLLYRPIDTISLRAAISRGLNRPKFDELSPFEQERNDRITIGSPDLDPARSLNLDVGAEYADQHFLLGVNYFYRDIRGVIEEVDTGLIRNRKRIFQVQNVGNGWTSGFELEQRLNLGFTGIEGLKGLTLWANQTFLDSELADASGRKRRFKDQPSFVANLGLDYTYEPWGTTFTIAYGYISKREEFRADGSTKTIEPASTLSLGVRQRIGANVFLFFEATDLLGGDKKVEREFSENGSTSRKEESVGD
ncbi:MAG: TonB-dependent receptor, partial [Leptolyngbyaceae cyanobacterium RU_5_1]|nr:TonB-dependent receptor [Leptolyngbyaceae cyanobacterium RU_5_1]